ncbi:unnamed protein product [Heterobilharzia americana]|nr:unnamed protein product [Heterobilharzia americana]
MMGFVLCLNVFRDIKQVFNFSEVMNDYVPNIDNSSISCCSEVNCQNTLSEIHTKESISGSYFAGFEDKSNSKISSSDLRTTKLNKFQSASLDTGRSLCTPKLLSQTVVTSKMTASLCEYQFMSNSSAYNYKLGSAYVERFSNLKPTFMETIGNTTLVKLRKQTLTKMPSETTGYENSSKVHSKF